MFKSKLNYRNKYRTLQEIIMSRKGITWNEEYRKRYFSSPKVQEHLVDFIEQASSPKPPEQREKMSQAKQGRKYEAEHKQRMSEAHKLRQALKRNILKENPELPIQQVWERVREQMETE